MKSLSKTAGKLIAMAVIAVAVFVLSKFYQDDPADQKTFTPKDDRFAPVVTEKIKPNLIGQYPKTDVVLPRDIDESDIEKIIRVYPKQDSVKKIDIIIDKKGRVFVEKKLVDSIKVLKYEQPIFRFKPEFGVGVAYDRALPGVQPSLTLAALHIKKLKAPVIEGGIRSAGVGIQYPVTGRLNAGLFIAADYKDLRRKYFKVNLTINF